MKKASIRSPVSELKPPASFTLNSDGNVLDFLGFNKATGLYSYKYVVSKTKKGMIVTFTEDNLRKLLKNNEIWEKQKP